MQADQTVLSLCPGGGGNRGHRLCFGSIGPVAGAGGGGFSSDLPLLRSHGADPATSFKAGDEGHEHVQYTRDQLLQLRQAGDEGHECVQYTRDQLLQLRQVIDAPEDILKIKEETAVELFGEDQSWGRGDANSSDSSYFNWLVKPGEHIRPMQRVFVQWPVKIVVHWPVP